MWGRALTSIDSDSSQPIVIVDNDGMFDVGSRDRWVLMVVLCGIGGDVSDAR